jgi:N-acyl-D-amino-acid deacylase
MLDSAILGGTIVDGLGNEPRRADLGIKDGIIVEISERLSLPSREVIDATGAIVTPGFIDMHTHYDGQLMWDDLLDPSFSNGVTTVVAGNCGVGFAPVRPQHRTKLMELMEGVEEIPEIVLDQGLDWNWTSFSDFLARIAERAYSMDVAVQLAHAPLRVFVMGDRALAHEPATDEDVMEMSRLVKEAMASGAIGVSASRILEHRSSKDEAVPGTFAEDREILALASAMGETERGTFQIVPLGMIGGVLMPEAGREARLAEFDRIVSIAKACGRPVTFLMQEFPADPEDWRIMLARTEHANNGGLQIRPQISARGVGMILTLDSHHPFSCRPSYRDLLQLPRADRAAAMRAPEMRAAILRESNLQAGEQGVSDQEVRRVAHLASSIAQFFLVGEEQDPEPGLDRKVETIGRVKGVPPLELLYDWLTEGDGSNTAVNLSLNYHEGNLDAVREMLIHPSTVSGLGDGGAHMWTICDASATTSHLTFWARDRHRGPRLPLEFMVRKITQDNAELYGLTDRGALRVGLRADINVIDLERLRLGPPRMEFDLPLGGGRLLQPATGYLATIVAGVVTRRNDEDTGARPGRLIRSGDLGDATE